MPLMIRTGDSVTTVPGVTPPDVVGLGIQPFASNNPPPNNEHIVPEVRISNDVLPTPAAAGGPVQSNGPYPDGFQAIINNPNSVLQDDIANQDILGTITIPMSTGGISPGVSQIPFLASWTITARRTWLAHRTTVTC